MKICPICSVEYSDAVRFCPNDGQTLRASSPAHDLVGQVIADRYHVVKKLGEGGMRRVYLAEHIKMGRKSAIKVMNPAMVHDPDAVARFNREAANASRITHPNVCAIYDFGETPGGLIYLAMEFIAGEPLTDLLEREGALPVDRAASIFVQMAAALQAAHDLGIPATAADGRRRAAAYYDNPDVPSRLRAQAAFMVANAYFVERQNDAACRWNGLALGLSPANESYLKFKRDQGCP